MTTPGIRPKSLPRVVLFLPGTIDTGNTPYISPRDPRERLQQYRTALELWLGARLEIPIVVAENSGSDLTPLREVVGTKRYRHDVEFLTFGDNSIAASKGKGRGELRTLEYALEHSSLLREADLIWKVTGRYFVRNSRQLLERTVQWEHAAAHIDLAANLTFADTRCFFASPEFLQRFVLPRREEIDDLRGVYLEHAAARAVHAAMAEGWHWLPLPLSPNLMGIAGVSGRSYDRSPPRRLADSIRRRAFVALLRHP